MKRDELDIIGGPTEVAKLCGVKPSAVSMWFTKDKDNGHVPYKHARKIAEQFAKIGKHVSVEYIVGE